MARKTIISKHADELFALKVEQRKEWKELGKKQEADLLKNDNVVGLAERFAKEREDHNKRFEKLRKDLINRQQKELEETKKIQQFHKSDDELEM